MRLLIYSGRDAFSDYLPFARVLPRFGINATCVCANDFASTKGPLKIIPLPTLSKVIKQLDPDIVLVNLPYYTPQMAKLTGRPTIYHMLGNIWTEFSVYKTEPPSVFSRMYNYYLGAVLNEGIKRTDLILANSRWLLDSIKENMPGHPADILYTGIDDSKWVPYHRNGYPMKHPAVVGTIDFSVRQKVLGLVKFTRVVRKMPEVNFYFAGDGPYFNLVKDVCPANMNLMGRISLSDVSKLLDSGDVFVHPSGLDVLPRSVKEACLMEKPIVASNVGGIPEIVINNQTGYLCEINDTNGWAEKIRYLLDNPVAAQRFGKKAREFVSENFNWLKIAANFLKTLDAIRS